MAGGGRSMGYTRSSKWTRVVSYNPITKMVIVLIAVIHWTISRRWKLVLVVKKRPFCAI